MGRPGTLAHFICTMHYDRGVPSPESSILITALETGQGDRNDELVAAGLALRSGRASTPLSKKITRAAQRMLQNYTVWSDYVLDFGYSPLLVRAAISYHYARLEAAYPGTAPYCVFLDLNVAIQALPDLERAVVRRVIAGRKLRTISDEIGKSAGPVLARACHLMAETLEGVAK